MTKNVNGTMLLFLKDVSAVDVLRMLGEDTPQSYKFVDPINGNHWALYSRREEAKVYAGPDFTILHRLSFENPWTSLPAGIDNELVHQVVLLDAEFTNDPPESIYIYHGGQVWAARSAHLVTETKASERKTLECSQYWNLHGRGGDVSRVVELFDLIESGNGPIAPDVQSEFSNSVAITALEDGFPPRHTLIK